MVKSLMVTQSWIFFNMEFSVIDSGASVPWKDLCSSLLPIGYNEEDIKGHYNKITDWRKGIPCQEYSFDKVACKVNLMGWIEVTQVWSRGKSIPGREKYMGKGPETWKRLVDWSNWKKTNVSGACLVAQSEFGQRTVSAESWTPGRGVAISRNLNRRVVWSDLWSHR